jgi:acyl-CoA thioester hydrolase
MRPTPFIAKRDSENSPYVRDKITGLVWHRCGMRIPYADTDRSRMVYHAHYLRYFEFGRSNLMRDADYPHKEIEDSGHLYPIFKANINYFHPLYYDDLLHIHTRPASIRWVRLQFEYVLTHGKTYEIICKGYTHHCAINNAGQPVEIDPKTFFMWQEFPKQINVSY